MIDLGQGVIYGSLFVTGLAGSLHCIGMCGPILLAFSGVLGRSGGAGRLDFLAYHAGRVWTYGMLGLLAGWAGSGLRHGSAHLGWQRPLAVGLAVLVIASGIVALGLVPRFRFDFSLSGCGAALSRRSWLSALLREPRAVARLLLGVVMGLLPCGLVYSMLLVVAALPTPLHSALGMLCFGAGTLPALSAFVLAGRVVPRWIVPEWIRAQGTRLAAVLLVGIGVFMLLRALMVHQHG